MNKNYGVLILAAGASRRMGTSKQLLQIDGQSLLRKTIQTALAISPFQCAVVLGADFEVHVKEIEGLPVEGIHNPEWDNGIGSSIKAGIRSLQRNPPDAFFILVCDQPLLTHSHLKRMADRYESTGSAIVASTYQEIAGVPALFDWSVSEKLLQLEDNEGAKKIIKAMCTSFVDFEGGETDLDTEGDYNQFLNKHP